MLQPIELEGGYVQNDSIFLPKSPLGMIVSSSPVDGIPIPAFPWEVVDEFLVLPSLLDCLYFNPPAVSLLLFQFCPTSHTGEENE